MEALLKKKAPLEAIVSVGQNKKLSEFELLYDKYAPPLYGWILSKVKDVPTAENVLSQTFVSMWLNIGEYNPGKSSFLIWLMKLSCIEIKTNGANLPDRDKSS